MKVIYKYQLSVTDRCVIALPLGFKILTLQMQNDMPHIWVEINPDEVQFTNVAFRTIGTGQKFVEDDLTYIGTYQFDIFVFHVYQEVDASV
jgi:hypothetical protein